MGKTPKPIAGMTLFSVTPLNERDEIDMAVWQAHIEWAHSHGADSVALFGSTGSNGFFAEAEKIAAFETIIPALAGKLPVLAGIGALTTGEAVRMAKRAEAAGADALLAVTVNYWRPTERELIAHYAAIASATALPLWLYNNPPLAGIDLTPRIVAEIAKVAPTVVGMKDSSGDLKRVFMVPEITGGKVAVGLGQDVLPVEALMGASPAWFTGLANFHPAGCSRLWDLAKGGHASDTIAQARALFALSEFGGRYGIVRVAHTALGLMGKPIRAPRAPLRNLDEAATAELRQLMAEAGLL